MTDTKKAAEWHREQAARSRKNERHHLAQGEVTIAQGLAEVAAHHEAAAQALEAHVAAAVEVERERVRAAVEAVQRYDGKILDAVPMTASPDGRWISRADVLAALDAKGG